MLPVAVARSFSDDSATRYVLLVLWMTSFFTQWGQLAKIKHDVVSSSSPDGGIAVYDCRHVSFWIPKCSTRGSIACLSDNWQVEMENMNY